MHVLTMRDFFWAYSYNETLSGYPLQIATYFWSPANGNKFYGVEATLDVYGFPLGNDQVSQASIWILDRGDGQPSSLSGFQAGWNVSGYVHYNKLIKKIKVPPPSP